MKILIAEDDSVSRRMLTALLSRSGYEVVAVEDGVKAWEILQAEDAPRLALLDWMMPGMDGVDVCRQARKQVGRPYAYLILLTAKGGKVDVIEGLESGADDYLTKPYDAQELKARMRVGLRILELEDNLVASRDAMQFKATHDPLTGLWNRGAVLDFLQRELSRARREKSALGILLCDLDDFKCINDTRGHEAGDEVLREVARHFKGAVRPYDAVGRYGGEEFLILLPGCELPTTRQRAEELRAAIAAQPVQTAQGNIPVTLSMGVLVSRDWPQMDADALLRTADDALYRAKAAGRNCVELARPSGNHPIEVGAPVDNRVSAKAGKR